MTWERHDRVGAAVVGERARRHRGRVATILALVLVLPTLVVTPAGAQFTEPIKEPLRDGVTYEWWDGDWHLRVPVIVRPRLADDLTRGPDEGPVWTDITGVTNFPVRVELDFTDIVRRIGDDGKSAAWPRDDLGRLSSFHFDPGSVRVVAYDRETGKIQRSLGEEGELPSRFMPRLLENPNDRNPVFNASSNAVGTLFFILPDEWKTQQLVFVYFDIVENGEKPAASFPPEDEALLDGLHWTRWGTSFTGFVPQRAGTVQKQPGLKVLAIMDNTTVAIRSIGPVPGAAFANGPTLPRCEKDPNANPCVEGGRINPKTGSELPVIHTSETLSIGPAGQWFFRIDATKPVLVYLDTPNAATSDITSVWYPSVDGGVVGTKFRFESLGSRVDCSQCDGTHNPNTLRVLSLEGRADVTINGVTCSVPKGAAKSLESCGVAYRQNQMYFVSSTKRIALGSTGWSTSHALQAVDAYGRPFGREMFVPIATISNVAGWKAGDGFLYSLDPSGYRLPPSGTTPYGKGGVVWNFDQQTHQTRGEMWSAVTSTDATVMGGMWGIWAAGGKGMGRDFLFPATNRMGEELSPVGLVMPLYDDTIITITDEQNGNVVYTGTASFGDGISCNRETGECYITNHVVGTTKLFRVTATKPVALYGVLDNGAGILTTFFSGRVGMPDHAIGPADYHGCLVGWAGDRSQSGTFTPGDTATFRFQVSNLGRGLGGAPLDDDVLIKRTFRFDVRSSNQSWKDNPPSITPLSVTSLASGSKQEIVVNVPIPTDAVTGDIVEVSLVAQSGCNPNIQDAATARVTVKTRYALDMKFSVEKRKEVTRSLESDGTTAPTQTLDITATNAGTGNDSFTFRVTMPKYAVDEGFEAVLYDRDGTPMVDAAGLPTRNITLGRGESGVVTLFVKGPSTANALPEVPISVGGQSERDGSARDQVTATVLLNAERSFEIDVDSDVLPVAPGQNATFNLRVTNTGSPTDAALSVVAALGNYPGWNVSLECGSFACDRIPINGGANHTVNLTVEAGSASPVGTILTVKVEVAARDGSGGRSALPLTARVVNNFDLEVLQGPPRSVSPGEEVTFDFIVDSHANGPMTAEIVPLNLPSGWRLLGTDPVGSFTINTTDKPVVGVDLKVRDNEAAGPYTVGIGLVLIDSISRERTVKAVTFPVNVQRILDLNLSVPPDLQAAPGGTVRVPVLVENTGNDDATVDMALTGPAGWTVELLDQRNAVVTLTPGASQVVNFSVRAPDAPSNGAGRFTARASNSFEQLDRSHGFDVGVLRRDLGVLDVRALTDDFRVGRTAAFEVDVINNGTRPAANVELALVVDGKVAANLTIRSLPVGEAKTFTLAWTITSTDVVTVVVDPREILSDDDRANNAFTFSLDNPPSGPSFLQRVPGPAAGITFLCLLGVALLMGRRRSGA